ncbi:cytochrome C biogenesis protein CcsA [Pseudomonas jessenii]|uniref:Cytochrome c-551 n=1 Tax=Pseudomonas jessenii TaxID=77298 RepID=A0A2W0F5H8_PSEJE|nr:c-type cytochrome [Pseudomonas jessenii]PYY72475.1 cytochrome C biogenesis protein CcsA [Pseudomonas jessenii]
MKKFLLALLAINGLVVLKPAVAQDGEALFKSKPCVACHSVNSMVVGPALKEVAAKYAGQDGATQMLAVRIKNGTQGRWGPIPMPPNRITDEEANTLAEWVLSLK